jgi:pimeloyl-ACP methyl ester carboxylesterase
MTTSGGSKPTAPLRCRQQMIKAMLNATEHEEFIKSEHAEYLARSIPNTELVVLDGVSHFAPLQGPEQFSAAMLAFVSKVSP